MHWRRWLGILAVFGVLLHAAAVVRHNAVMLAAASGGATPATVAGVDHALAADLHVICSAGGALAKSMAPGDGDRGGTEACPICAGLASAHALPAVVLPDLAMPYVERAVAAAAADERVSLQRRIRPPSRGPPSLA